MPSKEEIRKKYGIKEDDFQILTKLPSKEELMKEGACLKKIGFWDKFETWTKTTIVGGLLLAICFIGEMKEGVKTVWEGAQIVYVEAPQVIAYADHFSEYVGTQAKGLLICKAPFPTLEDIKHQQWAILPTGSGVYPLSANWK